MERLAFALLTVLVSSAAQTPAGPPYKGLLEFDVVSIKRNDGSIPQGGIRTLPDGTLIMTNHPIRSIISRAAAPVPVRDVVGYPDWVDSESYDVTVKPPAGSSPEQQAAMWRAMFAERMKLISHVEERPQTTFALVVARGDGKLGSELKPSILDCTPRPPGSPPSTPPPVDPSKPPDFSARCGGRFGSGEISGTMTLDMLVQSISGQAGGLVNNRTGLNGTYTFTLKYSPRDAAASADPADPPEFLTALREQLGLKLEPEKTMVPVLVIDRIERPTEN